MLIPSDVKYTHTLGSKEYDCVAHHVNRVDLLIADLSLELVGQVDFAKCKSMIQDIKFCQKETRRLSASCNLKREEE